MPPRRAGNMHSIARQALRGAVRSRDVDCSGCPSTSATRCSGTSRCAARSPRRRPAGPPDQRRTRRSTSPERIEPPRGPAERSRSTAVIWTRPRCGRRGRGATCIAIDRRALPPGLGAAIDAAMHDPGQWLPYRDTAGSSRDAARRRHRRRRRVQHRLGRPWAVRPPRTRSIDIGSFTLSCEVGVAEPDRAIFAIGRYGGRRLDSAFMLLTGNGQARPPQCLPRPLPP